MMFRNQMKKEGNSLCLVKRKPFNGVKIDQESIRKVFDFAYTMADNNLHREHRTGGNHIRTPLEIFWDTFRGKLAEMYVYKFYKSVGAEVGNLDFSIYDRGTWDDFDISINRKSISVKSTKHFGQLLLLEKNDFNDQGIYLPSQHKYDFFMLVRTKLEFSDTLSRGNLKSKEYLKNYCLKLNVEAEISGLLSHNDFVNQIIKYRYIILKGQRLNGKIRMDADNYYIHASDLENYQILLS